MFSNSTRLFVDDTKLGAVNIYGFPDNVSGVDEGLYNCIVSNILGTVSSDTVQLTVESIPEIISQPEDMVICENSDTTLSIEISGASPFFYLWYKNDIELPGSDFPYYHIENANFDNTAKYKCVVSSICGSIESEPIDIIVFPNPEINLGSDTAICEGNSLPCRQLFKFVIRFIILGN